MSSWAARRKLFYISCVVLFFTIIAGLVYITYIYKPPSCFDGIKNGFEEAIDCGGGCQLVCPLSAAQPNVQWARAFEVGSGLYNLAGVVENPNFDKQTEIEYSFQTYDEDNLLVTEVFNTLLLKPAETRAIFEPAIVTGTRDIKQVFLEFSQDARWVIADIEEELLVSGGYSIQNTETIPSMQVTIRNNDVKPSQSADVLVVLYDEDNNVHQVAKTFIESIQAQGSTSAFFTWRRPFTRSIERADIYINEQ